MIHLGAFELDPATAELSRAGRRVHLPSQSARLLLLLASRSPEVVSRDEIRRALWGDGLHVEFDAAVNACISQIRSALGDSARAPRFIETIPRQGYRCLVKQAEPSGHRAIRPSGQPEDGAGHHQADRPAGAHAASLPLLAAVLVAAMIALLWVAGGRARATGSSNLAAMQKYERGISGLADASPDELIARVRYFETAIAADPDFAAAYAGLAGAKLLIGAYRVEPGPIAYAAAKAAAQRALSIDPGHADAHAMFGAAVLHFEWDWRLA
jgi:DNA-binding winged helix-turn-helix (wHTH) protein